MEGGVRAHHAPHSSVPGAGLIHRTCPPSPPAHDSLQEEGYTKVETHLSHGRVDLQNLLVTFDLAHAEFAGELTGGGAGSLQGEGTVQGLLVAAPHLGEGEFLRRQKEEGQRHESSELSEVRVSLRLYLFLRLISGLRPDTLGPCSCFMKQFCVEKLKVRFRWSRCSGPQEPLH